MAGFAGHAVFPAIYRDMENPKKYDQMVDITYVLTITVYALMAISGYLMFGSETMQEVMIFSFLVYNNRCYMSILKNCLMNNTE